MTTTREDRERANERCRKRGIAGHVIRSNEDVQAWVESGDTSDLTKTMRKTDKMFANAQRLLMLAAEFAEAREAAVKAERERIEREFDRQWNDEHQVSVLAIRRIVRGEAKGGSR